MRARFQKHAQAAFAVRSRDGLAGAVRAGSRGLAFYYYYYFSVRPEVQGM